MNGSPYCSERDRCIQTHCHGECQEQIESLFDCRTDIMFGNTPRHCNLCTSGQSVRASIHSDMHTKEHKDTTGHSALRGQGGERMVQVHRTPTLTASEWKTFFANKLNTDLSTVDNWVTDEELEETQRNVSISSSTRGTHCMVIFVNVSCFACLVLLHAAATCE